MSDTLTLNPASIHMLETLQEVELLLAHERAHPDLPDDARWAGEEAHKLLRWILRPDIEYITATADEVEPLVTGGIALRVPGGYKPYGGAPVCFAPSADGAYMFGQCANGPLGFGMYVFRQVGAGPAEMLQYGTLMPGRGVFDLGGDGILYVTGSYEGTNSCVAYVVPGYVRFTPNGPMPVPIPQVVPVEDATARSAAKDAQSTANTAKQRADEAKQTANAAQTTANQALQLAEQPNGLTVEDLKNLLWNDPWYRGDCYGHWIAKDAIAPGVLTRLNEIAVAAVGAAPPSGGSDGALEQRVADLEQQLAALALRVTQGGMALTGMSQPA